MLDSLSDETLLLHCKEAVRKEKQSTLEVLEYLVEVDKRRLYLKEGYSSLYDFCIRYLHYSEGETNRRIQASRLTTLVEEVKPLLEDGSLSLTTMSLLSPHLTTDNAKEILPQVINQPTREVEKVLVENFPEKAKKPEILKIELDQELIHLLEDAKRIASEKNPKELLKKVLGSYVREKKQRNSKVKSHTRYVKLPTAREVKERAGFQCQYVSARGIRCNQRAHLQIDHVRPYAKGGSSLDIDNLQCLCKAHNLYRAKLDFPNHPVFSG